MCLVQKKDRQGDKQKDSTPNMCAKVVHLDRKFKNIFALINSLRTNSSSCDIRLTVELVLAV